MRHLATQLGRWESWRRASLAATLVAVGLWSPALADTTHREEASEAADLDLAPETLPILAQAEPDPIEEPVPADLAAEPAAAEPATAEPKSAGGRAVSAVRWEAIDSGTRVTFAAERKPDQYRYFQMTKPTRVIVDLYGLRAGSLPDRLDVGLGGIESIRVGRHADKVRFVVGFAGDAIPRYEVALKPEGAVLTVLSEGARQAPDLAKAAGGGPALASLDFKQLPEASRVQIGASEAVSYRLERPNPLEYVVDIPGLRAASLLTKPLDTTYFNSFVKSVKASNYGMKESRGVRVTTVLKEPVEAQVWQEDGVIALDFPLPPADVRPAPPPIERVAAMTVPAAAPAAPRTAQVAVLGGATPVVASETGATITGGSAILQYSGKKISLDLKDANIKDVLRLIADVSNLNIVAGEDVVGLLTIRLVDVPWDQAFDVILASQDLGMERIGNVVRVAPLDVIRKAEEKRLAASKAKQNTENMVLRVIPVSYVTAEDLQKQVEAVRSPRGTVTVDTRTNSVLYRDVVSKISEVEDLVKVLDAPTRAVHIEARIVEASTNFTRELGIQIGGSNRGIDIESGTLSIVGGRAGPAGAPIDDFAINLPALTGLGTGGALGFLFESKDASLDVRISALESAGKAKLISSPRVTTLDNIEASIKQGESIPFATVSDQGTETQFFEANLELKVTPHVTADERVRLKILITNDNADFSRTTGTGDPSFITQQAQTQVLLDDGETTVIGGIYTQDLNEDGDGVPYLQNIPILGHMFKKSGVRDESRELIIFITPKIVRPN